MSENKGKPSQQKADERKERETTTGAGSRAVHRLDRSRSDEKGSKGDSVKSTATAAKAQVRRRSGSGSPR
jgi:hypothetical protein